jgi:chemotaxis response regulator CheB
MSECEEELGEKKAGLLIAIGASAGGLLEIKKIVDALPATFEATLLIANHRSPHTENVLLQILEQRARVQVDEPEDEGCLERTVIYVGNARDVVEVDGSRFSVEQNTSRKSRLRRIDDLFCSVAQSAPNRCVGVILTGMLRDGVDGLLAIHRAGGFCIAQDPQDAAFESMPREAIREVPVDFVGTTEEIVDRLLKISRIYYAHPASPT